MTCARRSSVFPAGQRGGRPFHRRGSQSPGPGPARPEGLRTDHTGHCPLGRPGSRLCPHRHVRPPVTVLTGLPLPPTRPWASLQLSRFRFHSQAPHPGLSQRLLGSSFTGPNERSGGTRPRDAVSLVSQPGRAAKLGKGGARPGSTRPRPCRSCATAASWPGASAARCLRGTSA